MKKYWIILSVFFHMTLWSQTNIHKVIPGETIYTIARFHGTTAERIAAVNHFDLTSVKLEVGQKIIIPHKYYEVKIKEEKPTYITYTIKPGDNFYTIARDHSVSMYELIKLNKIKGNTIPKVGEKLVVPVKKHESDFNGGQEQKLNLQQGDKVERERFLEIEMEPREYYFVKNVPYKRAKLITDFKELPIQMFFTFKSTIDTGRANRIKRLKQANGQDTSITAKKEKSKKRKTEMDAADSVKAPLDTAVVSLSDTFAKVQDSVLVDTNRMAEANKEVSHSEQAWLYFKNGDTAAALMETQVWLSTDSLNSEAHYLLSAIHKLSGQLHAALSAIDKAIELSPDKGFYFQERSDIFAKQKETQLAISDLKTAVEKGNTKDEIYIKIALLYELDDDFDHAIEYYDKEIGFNPQSGISHYFKGMLYLKMNNKSLACESLNKAKELNFKLADEALNKNCSSKK